MEENSIKNNRAFYIFLIIYFLCWSFCQFLRHQIGIDAMEAICWGELLDFGTNKHPPLSGWIIASVFNIFGQNDHAIYFLGSACITIGLFFIYKLAKFFLSAPKAVCASIIMTACFYYTFTLFDDNFNCNTLSIALWPMIAYFYYKSVRQNKIKDWIIFGASVGLGTLAKYQVVFLILALVLHFLIFENKYLKRIGVYVAVCTGLAVIAPHVIWLFNHDFFSFAYMTAQAEIDSNSAQVAVFSLKRLFSPIKFLLDQVLAVSPCIAAYFILSCQCKKITEAEVNEILPPEQKALLQEEKTINNSFSDKFFIISICFLPAIFQGLMGAITGGYIHGSWGSIMIAFTGIALFYFFPIEFNKNSFKFFLKLIYSALIVWILIMAVFSTLQVKLAISYPYESNINYFHKVWAENTNNAPLKYVGGHIDYIFQFRIYDKSRPHVILETFGYKNPWENHEDILKSGAIIFSKKADKLEQTVKDTIILLPDNYMIIPQELEYEIKNKFGRVKKFKLYYAIIPPFSLF